MSIPACSQRGAAQRHGLQSSEGFWSSTRGLDQCHSLQSQDNFSSRSRCNAQGIQQQPVDQVLGWKECRAGSHPRWTAFMGGCIYRDSGCHRDPVQKEFQHPAIGRKGTFHPLGLTPTDLTRVVVLVGMLNFWNQTVSTMQ